MDEPQVRLGRLYLYSFSEDSSACPLVEIQRRDTSAILDMKWCHVPVAGHALLGVADAGGSIELLRLVGSENVPTLHLSSSCVLEEHCLALSLDWSTGSASRWGRWPVERLGHQDARYTCVHQRATLHGRVQHPEQPPPGGHPGHGQLRRARSTVGHSEHGAAVRRHAHTGRGVEAQVAPLPAPRAPGGLHAQRLYDLQLPESSGQNPVLCLRLSHRAWLQTAPSPCRVSLKFTAVSTSRWAELVESPCCAERLLASRRLFLCGYLKYKEKQGACTVSVSHKLPNSLVYGADWSWLTSCRLPQTQPAPPVGSSLPSDPGTQTAEAANNLKVGSQLLGPPSFDLLVGHDGEACSKPQSGAKGRPCLQPLTEDTILSNSPGTKICDFDLYLETANLDSSLLATCSFYNHALHLWKWDSS
ncbi:diphthine methyltransferase isoform X1 [Pteropus medius]|nr:diphthine methyltransferase isoform X1 [Pteropus giganteus]